MPRKHKNAKGSAALLLEGCTGKVTQNLQVDYKLQANETVCQKEVDCIFPSMIPKVVLWTLQVQNTQTHTHTHTHSGTYACTYTYRHRGTYACTYTQRHVRMHTIKFVYGPYLLILLKRKQTAISNQQTLSFSQILFPKIFTHTLLFFFSSVPYITVHPVS